MTRSPVVGWTTFGVASTVVLVSLAVSGMRHGATTGSDSEVLVRGVQVAFDCVRDGRLTGCGDVMVTPDSVGHIVGPFPLLQYLPAAVIVALGASAVTAQHLLAWLNLVALAVLIGLTIVAGRRLPSGRVWTPLLLIVAISGPLYFYATSSLGELLTATVLLAAVVAALYRRPHLIVVATALACLGKETVAPFVVVLVVVAARADDDGWLPSARLMLATLVGAACGVLVNGLFNVFRYGTPANRYYLMPELRADPRVRPSFFGAVFAAPNGGLAWFWSMALLLIVLAGLWALASAVRDRRPAIEWVPVLAVVGVVVLWAVGLAAWFSPFGWGSWGPRLFIIVIPAAAVALVRAGGALLADAARRAVMRPLFASGAILIAVLCAWPQAAAPWTWRAAVDVILTPDSRCPAIPDIWGDPLGYQRCVAHIAWRPRPSILVHSLREQNVPSVVASVAVAVAILGLAVVARAEASRGAGGHSEVRAGAAPIRTGSDVAGTGGR